ncbi:MAG: hypothetical protein J3Q66DRAFT_371747 [Benniella sp.]|nr:MAG: hypothetical protein J3Q66DRAFT_371747 [Benniella sp.]
MGQAFLKAIRSCLAFITFTIVVHFLRLYELAVFDPEYWPTWLPLFLAIFSLIAYSWALKAQKEQRNIIKSNAARYTCSLLLCAAWLASPSYVVTLILSSPRQGGMADQFFKYWNCGKAVCNLGSIDLCGFFMAFLVLVEVIFAYHERSSNIHGADKPTSVTVAPAPVQQQQQPIQQ